MRYKISEKIIYTKTGKDRPEVEERALLEGVIGGICSDTNNYDVVIIALPPDAAMRFLDEARFQDGAVVADFCGVKEVIEKLVFSKDRNYRYVGCHPMAGKEVSGFRNSAENLFDGASMIITKNRHTDVQAVQLLQETGQLLFFIPAKQRGLRQKSVIHKIFHPCFLKKVAMATYFLKRL